MQQARIIAARRFFSICVILMLIFSLIPAMPASAETGKTIYVTSETNGGSDSNSGESEASALASFEQALEKAYNGDTIRIIGSVQTAQLSDDSPLVISKEVTITGGELSVSHSGIILGKNVTFSDMALRLKNFSRNAIIANGYTLTMNNVTNPSLETGMSAASLHLFAGSLSDTSKSVPDMGPHGRIELYGKVQVGEIHAGSLSDVYVTNDYETQGSNTFEKPVTIVFGADLSDSGTIGDVYACGAREVRDYTGNGPSLGDYLVTDHSLYKNSGGVEIVINASNGVKKIKVHGKTGIDRDTKEETTRAVVTYDSSSAYPRSLGAIEDISKLHVKKGVFSLENDADSARGFYNTEIHVEGGALLQLKNLKLEPNFFAVAKYTGGTADNPAEILLGNEQQFYIAGDVSGTTNVAINYSNFPDSATLDYVYISAPKSADGAFHLLPSATQTGKDFVRNDKGEWSVPSQASGIDISGANIVITDAPETLICIPGGVVEPDIEVYLDGERLGSEYYEVSYDWNDLPGEAYVVIQGKNGYTGTAKQLFNILPADVTDTKYTQAAYTVLAKGETKTVTLPALPHAEMKYGTPRDGNGDMPLTNLKVEASADGDDKYQLSFTAPSGNAGQSGRIIVPVEVKDPVGTNEGWSECCPYRNYELTATITSVGEAVVPYPPGGNSGGGTGGSGGGGGASPAVQKPIIEAAEGVNVTLSTDGTAATITVAEGYELVDVTVNDISKGAVTAVSGLKTGDKLVVKAAQKDGSELTKEEQKKVDTITGFKPTTKLTLTKLKNGKKAILISWNKSKYQFDGVEIWRSMKKNSGYGKKPIKTIKSKSTKYYYNTAIKKGKTYYYKLRGYVEVNGKKYYTSFSKKVYRTVK